ncbi:MAG: hypothetical protein FWC13_03435 [Oscillospiraceae bacterium]|nr:hypothetical protein [Oscillospiraceae bacterium]
MKKFLVLLFALVLVFTLTACATADEPFEEPQDDIPSIAEEPSPTEDEPSPPSEDEGVSPADEESSDSGESSDSEEPDLPESSPQPPENDPEDTETDFGDVPYDINFTHGFLLDHSVNATALGLAITRLEHGEDPEELEDITFLHMLDYDELRGSGDFENTDTLMIRASVPLHEFAVVNITNDAAGDRIVFFLEDAFGFVDTFLPSEAFIITSYVSVGTMPWSGISFLDENDRWWVFAILQNQADEGDAYLLLPLVAYG